MFGKKPKNQYQPSVIFQPGAIKVPIGEHETILDVALSHKIDLGHSCGGMGSCTTCRVIIICCPGQIPPRTELEQEMADGRKFEDEERLACQLPPIENMEVLIPSQKTDL